MTDPYARMLALLLPLTAMACVTSTTKGTDPHSGGSTTESGTTPGPSSACVQVPAGTAACPDPGTLVAGDLIGGCGSDILSIDGAGAFGSDPTGGDGGAHSGETWCCYPVTATSATCDYGRPYVVDGAPRLAEVREDAAWCGPIPVDASLPDEVRAGLAAAWLDAALDEHAAVAAFAQVALELVGFGAPADLVDATFAAGRDEVRHALLGFAIASRYAGAPRSAGALALSPHPPNTDLASFAAATAREGCVGETVNTLLAAECLARATDPAVRDALAAIVADEERHAALAWRTVAWAIEAGGEPVRAAVAAVFADVARSGVGSPDRVAPGDHPAYAAHGLPDAALARRAMDQGWSRVVEPAARALLERPVSAAPDLRPAPVRSV